MKKADQYFLEIARAGGLSRAADRLYVSQPSLTKLIQRLEQELGVQLFDRSVSPMRLSDAGHLYYRYLLEQEERERELHARLNQISRLERGTLRLGMPSFCAQSYLPAALARFKARYAHVEVTLLEASGEKLEQALLDQQIDLAILHLPVTHSELIAQPLFEERVLLAMRKDAPGPFRVLTEGCPELSTLDYILPLPEQKLGRFAANRFSAAGIRPNVVLRTQNVSTMLTLASLGMGAALVPEGGLGSISDSILEKLSFYALPGGKMQLCALRRQGLTAAPFSELLLELISNCSKIHHF